MRARDPEQLAGNAEGVPPDEAGRRAHREQYRAGTGPRDIDRDLRTRVSRADDEHATAAIRIASSVVRGVHQLPVERAAPGREVTHVAVPHRDDDAIGAEVLAVGEHGPGGSVSVDALDGATRPHVERVAPCVRAEVLDDTVARGPLPERARDPVARKAGQPPHRVQVKAVVARAPGGADVVALQYDHVRARTTERRGAREPRRPRADDVDHVRASAPVAASSITST